MVRFDSAILLQKELDLKSQVTSAVSTIKYLFEAGAKIILLSDWNMKINSKLLVVESVADFLSSVLQLKVAPSRCISNCSLSKMEELEKADILLLENLSEFKGELANCSKFAEQLSSVVDIFVNDSFSNSHKILASTVGVPRFCSACVAGFHFEESLCQLKMAAQINKKPCIAIIGGGNLFDKASAVRYLASRCDGLVFVGMMAFQIMHALGLHVPLNLLEGGPLKEASNIVQLAQNRKIPILYPKDFWCMTNDFPKQMEIFPAYGILDGWIPVDPGPKALDEINSLLTGCKMYLTLFINLPQKIIWIGPVKFRLPSQDIYGASKLVSMLDRLTQSNCEITVIGNMACKAVMKESSFVSVYNMVENASVVWEFLKGRKLPGLMALDRVCFLSFSPLKF
ncbi:Phosphoglycerate kinase [Vitis vinifera]|uniref:Phosphoglycerate kinase n=1 Tax=Vitis vinifera TaxID=29760 RepID=A0A438FJX3_VITVI|nr:Phosphoglycerate kinase [Vitis vinifera]